MILVHCITFSSNTNEPILAAIAFISCWQLYRQPFSRTHFLTEHIYKRLTFSMFIIQSEEKQRNSMDLLTNVEIIFLIWNSKYKYTTWNFLFIHTYDYWNNKHGDVKENVSCASSGIHLLSIFETLSQKLEVLLSIFCGTKNFFNPPPPAHY